MKTKLMNILKYTFVYLLIGLAAILNSCSDSDAPAVVIPGPIHVLRFTDNEEFRYLWYEETTVSNEEQTLTLKLRSIYSEYGEEDDIARIMKTMERYRFYIHEWEGDKMQEIWPYDSTQYNLPDDFYHVWWEKENGEHVVKVSLTKNDTGAVRRLSLDIWPGLKYKESPLIGYVTIIQEPASDFIMRIKYKGTYHTSAAIHDPEGNIIFKDEEFIKIMNEIDSKADIRTVIMEDGTVYYYDEEDMQRNRLYEDILDINESDVAGNYTRAGDGFADYGGELGYFGIFEDNTFSGSKIAKSFTNPHFTYDLPDLKSLNMNDKISSIALAYNGTDPMVCSVLTIWDDADFNYGDNNRSKHRISIIASSKSPKTTVTNLKNIKKHDSSNSWNDCISSTSFHFGYIDRALLDY